MEENTEKKGVRLAKFLAAAGIASRRNCEQLIVEGRVTVNGAPVTTPAHNIDPETDEVAFEGRPVSALANDKRVYILLNKPAGYTCSAKDDHAEKLVGTLIPPRYGRLFTVGRLDRESEGLLILTNDGDYAQQLMHPARRVTKRYYVECRGQYTTRVRRLMLEGMYDNGEFLQALEVSQKSVQRSSCALEITLGEGRKREVRRLCKDVGLEVVLLRRVAVGRLELGDSLPLGSWRMMTEDELQLATIPASVSPRAVSANGAAEGKPYWQNQREERSRERRFDNDRHFERHRNASRGDGPAWKNGNSEGQKPWGGKPVRRKPVKQIPAVPVRWYDAPEIGEDERGEKPRRNDRPFRREGGFDRRDERPARREGGFDRRDECSARRDGGFDRRDERPTRREGGFDRRDERPTRREGGFDRRDDRPFRRDGGFDRSKRPFRRFGR